MTGLSYARSLARQEMVCDLTGCCQRRLSVRPEAEKRARKSPEEKSKGLFSFDLQLALWHNRAMRKTPTLSEGLRDLGWIEEIDPVDNKPVFLQRTPVIRKLTDIVPGSRALIAGGMSAVCVTCRHMREAMDKGRRQCGESSCAGPLAGQGFPKYEGPLKGGLVKMCFVCGVESKLGIGGVGWQEPLGVCMIHEPWLKKTAGQGAP